MKFQNSSGEHAGDPNLIVDLEESFGVCLRSGGQGFSFLGITDLIQEGNYLGRLETFFWEQSSQRLRLHLAIVGSLGKCIGSGI